MAGTPDLFVVCKKCGSEVSPYITECPYCGTRLRKRAPKIDRKQGEAQPKAARRMPRPSLTPLRRDEIPGIRADPFGRPTMTIALVALSLFGFLALAFVDRGDVVLRALTGDEAWRYATSAFAYSNPWYEMACLIGIGVFGWRLELRHGWLLVLALFLACGVGGNAIAAAVEDTPFLLGAPGAAIGMLAAWAVPDVRRARRGEEHDGDLLGTLVIALVIALMPAATPEASAVATLAGLVIGGLTGLMLLRTQAARV
ncbi:MAG: rhomboid family intramembrane serine protease [Solirubrobacterales bacterium]|nr:rhomboid family intramembrane serine protease [Solirubrobacterales bacterium]